MHSPFIDERFRSIGIRAKHAERECRGVANGVALLRSKGGDKRRPRGRVPQIGEADRRAPRDIWISVAKVHRDRIGAASFVDERDDPSLGVGVVMLGARSCYTKQERARKNEGA
jgi:hypothetical protein